MRKESVYSVKHKIFSVILACAMLAGSPGNAIAEGDVTYYDEGAETVVNAAADETYVEAAAETPAEAAPVEAAAA